MVSLGVAIMHVDRDARRRANVIGLLRKLKGAPVKVVKDTHRSVWHTSRRAWQVRHPGTTHLLVLQDDVTVCADFVAGATRALERKPDVPISFYANRKVVEQAAERGDSWVQIADGSWGQACCVPIDLVDDFLAWERRHIDPAFKWDDTRWSMWALKTGRPFWCTVPSLAEHAGASESLLGNSNSRRTARRYIGDLESALRVDWSKGADQPLYDRGSMPARYWESYRDA